LQPSALLQISGPGPILKNRETQIATRIVWIKGRHFNDTIPPREQHLESSRPHFAQLLH
jgi:hypothetical protein